MIAIRTRSKGCRSTVAPSPSVICIRICSRPTWTDRSANIVSLITVGSSIETIIKVFEIRRSCSTTSRWCGHRSCPITHIRSITRISNIKIIVCSRTETCYSKWIRRGTNDGARSRGKTYRSIFDLPITCSTCGPAQCHTRGCISTTGNSGRF